MTSNDNDYLHCYIIIWQLVAVDQCQKPCEHLTGRDKGTAVGLSRIGQLAGPR